MSLPYCLLVICTTIGIASSAPQPGVSWVSQPSDLSVIVNGNASLPCEVQGTGAANLAKVWNKGTVPIFINGVKAGGVSDRYSIQGQNTLFIQNVTIDDDSFFTCTVFQFEHVQVKLTVLGRRQAGSSDHPAFTAYLSHYYNQMGVQDVVVFDKTLTNEGGFYNVSTGKFTVPVGGLYLFSFIIETKHAVDTAARLVVDGKNVLDAVVEPRHTEQNLQGGNVGILKLQEGQQVWIEIYNTNGQSLEGADMYRFTTFTGALLAEMDVFGTSIVG